MTPKFHLAGIPLGLLLAMSITGTPVYAAEDQKASCKSFVQQFYTWYVSKSKQPLVKNSSPLDIAMNTKKDAFNADLLQRLKEDAAASAKVKDEVVGLDFDPILNSQEQPEKYEAGNVSTKGTNYLVDVYSYSGGKKSAKPDVVPELAQSNGKWQFVNFHYKDTSEENLLTILKNLKEQRKPAKKK